MDRKELFQTEFARLMEPVFQSSIAALKEHYIQNEKKIRESLKDVLEKLYIQAGEMQAMGEKNTISWLGICYFLSSTYTDNYEIRMDLYDSESYLDKKTCCVYWNPSFITSYLLEDRAYFHSKIKQRIPRVKIWEEQKFLEKYARGYMYILGEFLRQEVPDTLKKCRNTVFWSRIIFRFFLASIWGNILF